MDDIYLTMSVVRSLWVYIYVYIYIYMAILCCFLSIDMLSGISSITNHIICRIIEIINGKLFNITLIA